MSFFKINSFRWAVLTTVLIQGVVFLPLLEGEGATAPAGRSELKNGVAPEWENLKDMDIIPCPKKISIYDVNLAVSNLAIIIGHTPSEQSRIAALDLQQHIKKIAAIEVPILDDKSADGRMNQLLLGTEKELPQLKLYCEAEKISLNTVEAQGYVIFPVTAEGKQKLILAGKDAQGVYWAAMTLSFLLKGNSIQVARIVDWPDFKNRVCENLIFPVDLFFKATNEQQELAAWQQVTEGIQEAARLKFNYIRCFTAWGGNPPTDSIVDNRAQKLARVGEYANQRGIRLFFNLYSAVGVLGDEIQFPSLTNCLFLKTQKLYFTRSNEELISRACERITRMAHEIGPQQYLIHSPYGDDMAWSQRSESEKQRWGNDRVTAEAYIANRMIAALKHGNSDAQISYATIPRHIPCIDHSIDFLTLMESVEKFSAQVSPEVTFFWGQGPVNSVQLMRSLMKNRGQFYWLADSSFHSGRLLGGTARAAKSFYFEGGNADFIYDHCNITPLPAPIHKPQLGILSEYSWNTRAPGSVYVEQKTNAAIGSCGVAVDGISYEEWANTCDLEGAISEALIPRACRLYFGERVGNGMALAYSIGNSYTEKKLGSSNTLLPEIRHRNSLVYSERLKQATRVLAGFWGKQSDFKTGTYPTYQAVFKMCFVSQYIEKINSYVARLSVIKNDELGEDRVAELEVEAFDFIRQARAEITAGYGKYHFENIPFNESIGDLKSVLGKVASLETLLHQKTI